MEQSLSIWESIIEAITKMTWIEVGAVITGLIYVLLAVKEYIACWFFGIISSVLSVYFFYTGKLYAESGLYVYYIIAGFYGWYVWDKRRKQTDTKTTDNLLEIHSWTVMQHVQAIGLGIVLALLLAVGLKNFTDANLPVLDSFTTIFSFIATYMVTRKVLENWLYWIVIDIVTTGMYFHREYYLYAVLMVIYTVVAIIGYSNWKRLKTKRPQLPERG